MRYRNLFAGHERTLQLLLIGHLEFSFDNSHAPSRLTALSSMAIWFLQRSSRCPAGLTADLPAGTDRQAPVHGSAAVPGVCGPERCAELARGVPS
jgi:hypothetical protein